MGKKKGRKSRRAPVGYKKGRFIAKIEKHSKAIIISIIILFILLILSGFFLGSDKMWQPFTQKQNKAVENR